MVHHSTPNQITGGGRAQLHDGADGPPPHLPHHGPAQAHGCVRLYNITCCIFPRRSLSSWRICVWYRTSPDRSPDSYISIQIPGVYNFTNPGAISHNEILALYKKHVDPSYTWTNFTVRTKARCDIYMHGWDGCPHRPSLFGERSLHT
jgi:hypothetical protein